MKSSELIPCLPENAPFTPEQRAYLNGFLAGLFSRAPVQAVAEAPPAPRLTSISILFGSQTGNAERLARQAAREAGRRGFAATIHDLSGFSPEQLAAEARFLVITSTYGDGEPPDNAKPFWNSLSGSTSLKLEKHQYTVCALGDSNYPKFCAFGRELDLRLAALGAHRVHPCAECDVDFEQPFAQWLDQALARMREVDSETGLAPSAPREINCAPTSADSTVESPRYGRNNPFPARLVVNRRLNGPGSTKDTRHLELDLNSSGLTYEPGDVLGVRPANCPDLVEEILAALACTGDEPVPVEPGMEASLREALLRHYEITRISQQFLEALAERSGAPQLKQLAGPGANGALSDFLRGRELIDVLLDYRAVRFSPRELVRLLRKLPSRLYSISSSPIAHAGRVHLTVGVVRYDSFSRQRKGVCSTFLAERVSSADTVPVFVHSNKSFRPPANHQTPMIMVGPGTGIAPFRAFLTDRRAAGAPGRSWLFFGDQKASADFLYGEELEGMLQEGTLERLDTAFSRDQAEKIYVQNRMLEKARHLFDWLEAGAHFYVCGDASRMAKDVDAALHEVVRVGGGRTVEQAAEYVDRLRSDRRYQRDVY